jgi:hypothetical protein
MLAHVLRGGIDMGQMRVHAFAVLIAELRLTPRPFLRVDRFESRIRGGAFRRRGLRWNGGGDCQSGHAEAGKEHVHKLPLYVVFKTSPIAKL